MAKLDAYTRVGEALTAPSMSHRCRLRFNLKGTGSLACHDSATSFILPRARDRSVTPGSDDRSRSFLGCLPAAFRSFCQFLMSRSHMAMPSGLFSSMGIWGSAAGRAMNSGRFRHVEHLALSISRAIWHDTVDAAPIWSSMWPGSERTTCSILTDTNWMPSASSAASGMSSPSRKLGSTK